MQIKQGAAVYTSEGDRVGSIDRVVIDPETKEITHLVVQKGLFFTQDKVVHMSLVASSSEDSVTLRKSAADLEELPDFEETHYIPAEGGRVPAGRSNQPGPDNASLASPLYWYPPVGPWWVSGFYSGVAEPKYIATTEQNIPEGMVALKEGAKVIGVDGEHVGDVERILTNSPENQVTHLLIAKGLFHKNTKLIPSRWVRDVFEDEVHLVVDSDVVEQLPVYSLPD